MKIELSKLPEGTKWIAIDEDGEVCAYTAEPGIMHAPNGSWWYARAYEDEDYSVLGNVHD